MLVTQPQKTLACVNQHGKNQSGRDARFSSRLSRYSHPPFDERVRQADRVFQRRSVIQPRQGLLRAQIDAAIEQVPASELESWIGPQKIEVVGVLVTAGDDEYTGADHVGECVGVAHGIALVEKQSRQPIGDPKTLLVL